jgi:hypothetical protein
VAFSIEDINLLGYFRGKVWQRGLFRVVCARAAETGAAPRVIRDNRANRYPSEGNEDHEIVKIENSAISAYVEKP